VYRADEDEIDSDEIDSASEGDANEAEELKHVDEGTQNNMKNSKQVIIADSLLYKKRVSILFS